MITKSCPQCGDDIAATARRHKCGWKQQTAPAAPSWTCSHTIVGMRCGKLACYSPSLLGGGPWFCRDHAPAFMRYADKPTAPPQGFAELKALVRARVRDREAESERDAIRDA